MDIHQNFSRSRLSRDEFSSPILCLGIDVTRWKTRALLSTIIRNVFLLNFPVFTSLGSWTCLLSQYSSSSLWNQGYYVNPIPFIILTHFSAEDELENPHDEDPRDPHQEGQDGGEEKTPPFSLLQTVLRIELKFVKLCTSLVQVCTDFDCCVTSAIIATSHSNSSHIATSHLSPLFSSL